MGHRLPAKGRARTIASIDLWRDVFWQVSPENAHISWSRFVAWATNITLDELNIAWCRVSGILMLWKHHTARLCQDQVGTIIKKKRTNLNKYCKNLKISQVSLHIPSSKIQPFSPKILCRSLLELVPCCRCRCSSAVSRSGGTAVSSLQPLGAMRPPRRQTSATEASRVCLGPKRNCKRFALKR